MYLALLVTTLPLILDEFSFLRLLFWSFLLVDLILKMNYEEGLLLASVDGYEDYVVDSHRIIPYVY